MVIIPFRGQRHVETWSKFHLLSNYPHQCSPLSLLSSTRRPLGANSGYLACVCKGTQHNVCIYHNLKANERSYVYIEVKANIL